MKNRQSYIMLVIGIVVGIGLGVVGSSDSLFGSATGKDDNNGDSGSAASVAEPTEAYMIDLSAVQAVLAEAYPDSAASVYASFAAAEALGDDPSSAPAVVADFQDNVLPLVYSAITGTDVTNSESAPENLGLIICFGIKTDPATGHSMPYFYATAPVSLKVIPSMNLTNYGVVNSPTALLNFQLLACFPKPE